MGRTLSLPLVRCRDRPRDPGAHESIDIGERRRKRPASPLAPEASAPALEHPELAHRVYRHSRGGALLRLRRAATPDSNQSTNYHEEGSLEEVRGHAHEMVRADALAFI